MKSMAREDFRYVGSTPTISTLRLRSERARIKTVRTQIIIQKLRVNNQIRIPRIQLIDENGNQLGVVETYRALEMARERNLDLVEVGPQAYPSICKIMDYGKYMYAKAKKERGRKVKKSELKSVRIGFRTSSHDREFKAAQVDKFLTQGHKVRVELRLRGREHTLRHLAREKLSTFFTILKEPYKFERNIGSDPRGLSALITREK